MLQDFDNIEPARLLICLLKLCGMWTFEGKWWNPLYRIYGWLLHFHFTFLFIAGMYINVGMANSLKDLSDALYMSLTETALVVKVLNSMLRTKKILEFLEIFDKNSEGAPKNVKEAEMAKFAHRGFRRLRNPYIAGSVMVLIFSFLTPVYDNTFALPFPCWMPFEYRNPEHYYYAYTFVSIGITVTATSNFTMDLYQAFLMLQLSINFKFLGNRLKEFGYYGRADDEMINKYFQHYSFLSRLTNDCQDFMSFPIFVQLILSAFVLCFTVYRLQNTKFSDNPNAFFMFVIFALIMSLQIYLPCNYGNELTTSAYDLTNAIYASGWTHLPVKQRKKIFIFMEYLKRPLIIKAGNVFNIGLGLYSQTMNNAYRLYALLLNIET